MVQKNIRKITDLCESEEEDQQNGTKLVAAPKRLGPALLTNKIRQMQIVKVDQT